MEMFIPRLFSYLLWLGIFVGPVFLVIVYDLIKRIGKLKAILIFVALVVLPSS
jgi:hypothetical protein